MQTMDEEYIAAWLANQLGLLPPQSPEGSAKGLETNPLFPR